jgi:hypothetical protein
MSDDSNLCGLTLDLDDVSIDDVNVRHTLDYLSDELGEEFVWYRVSSSGEGLHVLIAELKWDEFSGEPLLVPRPMGAEEQMKYRESISLECRGRRISDSYRKQVGLRTSRIFENKNGKKTGNWKKWVKA